MPDDKLDEIAQRLTRVEGQLQTLVSYLRVAAIVGSLLYLLPILSRIHLA